MALSLTYITTLSSATDASTYNFGNVTAASDGLLICVVVSRSASSTSVSSVSIGGTNGTIAVQNTSVNNAAAIATRAVSAGAHNVTVNFGATMVRCGCGVYLLTGYNSATPVDTDVGQASGATSNARVMTLDFPTNGVAVYGNFHGITDVTAWSAATEDYDASPESNARFSFAHKTASGAGNTETASWATLINDCGVAAVWQESTGGTTTPWYYMAQQRVVG